MSQCTARFGKPKTDRFTNNLLTLKVSRGRYRLQAVQWIPPNQGGIAPVICFCVSDADFALDEFPAGTTIISACGELLVPYSVYLGNTGVCVEGGYPVEVDVLDEQKIHFWSDQGTEAIKYVRVGELPSRESGSGL